MTTQAQTEIQNRFIKGLTWKALGSILVATISIVSSIIMGFQSLKDDVKDLRLEIRSVRYEVRTALDSVKYRQQIRSIETDNKFQKMDDRLIRIEQNTTK